MTPSPQHNFMREDDSKIKSYIKYENLGISKQNVLNGIGCAGVIVTQMVVMKMKLLHIMFLI